MAVWLTTTVSNALRNEAMRRFPLETGGMLLGWRRDNDCIIAGAIGPGPEARHRPSSFDPDHDWQMKRFHAAFSQSGGDLDYLGDWHTHPRGSGALSVRDRRTLAQVCRRVPRALMAVLSGPDARIWEFSCWRGENYKRFRWSPQFRLEECRLTEPVKGWPTYIYMKEDGLE